MELVITRLPKWNTVKFFYYRAIKKGIWKKVMDFLIKEARINVDRNADPSYALIDSQSIKTTYDSESRGYNGGKKIKGRKRHIVTDIMGNFLGVHVNAANIHDTKSGCYIFTKTLQQYWTIEVGCIDGDYCGTFKSIMKEIFKIRIDISKCIEPEF